MACSHGEDNSPLQSSYETDDEHDNPQDLGAPNSQENPYDGAINSVGVWVINVDKTDRIQ